MTSPDTAPENRDARQQLHGYPIYRAADGSYHVLVTRDGGDDPTGRGGYVHALGGSSCRWLPFDLNDAEASFRAVDEARAFHGERS